MSTKPTRCYAVSSGSYSGYEVHAIYRRREDAEARVEANNSRSRQDPEREESENMYVEEFDYYEGEPLPARLEGS